MIFVDYWLFADYLCEWRSDCCTVPCVQVSNAEAVSFRLAGETRVSWTKICQRPLQFHPYTAGGSCH